MRLLLTRRPAQAGDLEAGLRATDGPDGVPFEVGFLPATDTLLPDDGLAHLREAVAALGAGEYAVLVVTSPNGARALAAAGWDGGLPPGVRVAATGPGTTNTPAPIIEPSPMTTASVVSSCRLNRDTGWPSAGRLTRAPPLA